MNIDSNMKPVVYRNDLESDEDYIKKICNVFQYEVTRSKFFDIQVVLSEKFFLDNATVMIQKKSTQDFVKREVLDLEAILAIVVDEDLEESGLATIKVTRQMLDVVGVDEDVLWDKAYANYAEQIKIESLDSFLEFDSFTESPFLYVLTTDIKMHGAAALANPDILKNFCEENELSDLTIIPSSIHELLIIPEKMDEQFLVNTADLVNEVNSSTVAPAEQLNPVVYAYDLESNSVVIAASHLG